MYPLTSGGGRGGAKIHPRLNNNEEKIKSNYILPSRNFQILDIVGRSIGSTGQLNRLQPPPS